MFLYEPTTKDTHYFIT